MSLKISKILKSGFKIFQKLNEINESFKIEHTACYIYYFLLYLYYHLRWIKLCVLQARRSHKHVSAVTNTFLYDFEVVLLTSAAYDEHRTTSCGSVNASIEIQVFNSCGDVVQCVNAPLSNSVFHCFRTCIALLAAYVCEKGGQYTWLSPGYQSSVGQRYI